MRDENNSNDGCTNILFLVAIACIIVGGSILWAKSQEHDVNGYVISNQIAAERGTTFGLVRLDNQIIITSAGSSMFFEVGKYCKTRVDGSNHLISFGCEDKPQ